MAKKVAFSSNARPKTEFKHRTSIGRSSNSRPRHKYAKMSWKKYRGQGK